MKSEMRQKIVAGNWKMNKTLAEGVELAKAINVGLASTLPKCNVVLGVPFTHVTEVIKSIDASKIAVAAQNCADKASGAYTGEISASMIKSTGASHVILGHSERRAYYGETNAILKEKVGLALANNLTPIFCIGEVLEEREAEKQFEVVTNQLQESLFHLQKIDFLKIVIAYEPVWAIGTGKTATSSQAQEMHGFIRKLIAQTYSLDIANLVPILYGGSCNAGNAGDLFSNPDVDGGLIGGASLKADDFMAIVNAI